MHVHAARAFVVEVAGWPVACGCSGTPLVLEIPLQTVKLYLRCIGWLQEEEESSPAKSSPGPYKEQVLNEVSGKFETSEETKLDNGFVPALNPSMLAAEKGRSYLLMNPVYTKEYMESIVPKHRPPQGVRPLSCTCPICLPYDR